jgi:A/G-specific adenine glycosylase
VAFSKKEFRRGLGKWYCRHARDLPWRRTREPYQILVSEFMLQQTQVATVIPFYHEWLHRFPDFATLARASEEDVLHTWQGLGYYARARNLHATAKALLDKHDGRFPRSIEQMRQLPGVGKYTAHAVASFAFNQSIPIVEANTARVLTRLFDYRECIDCETGRETLWQYAATLVPRSNVRTYNSALVDLGALVCVARKPKCNICPVKKFCRAKNPAALPIKKPRPRTKRMIERHMFVINRGRVLLEQSRRRWRGMWILPPLKPHSESIRESRMRRPVYESVFSFTNHRIALNVYVHDRPTIQHRLHRWIRIGSLELLPVPSPHRRALRYLLSKPPRARVRRQQSSGS